MALTDIFDKLTLNPTSFWNSNSQCHLQIAGGNATNPGGNTGIDIAPHAERIFFKDRNQANNQNFYRIAPVNNGNFERVLFNTHIIPMYERGSVNIPATGSFNIPGFRIPERVNSNVRDNPDILITGELSGCAFCVLPLNGGRELICAHIRPPQGMEGKVIDQALYRASFTGYPGRKIFFYGRSDMPTQSHRSTVFGIRDRLTKVWTLYYERYGTNPTKRLEFGPIKLS